MKSLAKNLKSLVSLMNANNEIGNITSLEEVGYICKKHNSIFHSDTSQTMGHYRINTGSIFVDAMTGTAHKFHGPKGVGFVYIKDPSAISPFIKGGSQERNMRGGTENVVGIVGLARALEISINNLEDDKAYISKLKSKTISELRLNLPFIQFNGNIDEENSLYTVLNVTFPPEPKYDMIVFNLDIEGVMVSGSSACNSGSEQGSHVLRALNNKSPKTSIRISFSKYNTEEDIDYTIQKIKEISNR